MLAPFRGEGERTPRAGSYGEPRAALKICKRWEGRQRSDGALCKDLGRKSHSAGKRQSVLATTSTVGLQEHRSRAGNGKRWSSGFMSKHLPNSVTNTVFTWTDSSYLSLAVTLQGQYSPMFHFNRRNLRLREYGNWPEVTWLADREARRQAQACLPPKLVCFLGILFVLFPLLQTILLLAGEA